MQQRCEWAGVAQTSFCYRCNMNNKCIPRCVTHLQVGPGAQLGQPWSSCNHSCSPACMLSAGEGASAHRQQLSSLATIAEPQCHWDVVWYHSLCQPFQSNVTSSAGCSLLPLSHATHLSLKMIWAQRSAILQDKSKRPKRKRKRDKTQKRSHKKHGKPAQRAEHHKASKGTKRHHSKSEPAHRKRRKKR
jgi:hypothetical protein